MTFLLSLTALLAFAFIGSFTMNHPEDYLRYLHHLHSKVCPSIRRIVQAVPDTSAPVFVNVTSSSWLHDTASFNAAPLLTSANRPVCAAVAFARSTVDVVAAVEYAVSRGMPVQARSGRHSYLAFTSATENALVVDVGNMSVVGRVREEARLWRMPNSPSAQSQLEEEVDDGAMHVVTVGAGARLFYLAEELADQGFVFPGGSCPTVGTGGFALGGGYGFFSRAYGMASDNIVGATVVQVDAAKNVVTRRVSLLRDVVEPSVDDLLLLWALRGGGNNNFGIVTELILRVYPTAPRISHWRIDFPGKQSCVGALAMYQTKLVDEADNKRSVQSSSSVTYQLNVYRNYFCSVLAVGYGMSKGDLQTEMESWKTLPNATSKESEPTETNQLIDVVVMLAGCKNVTVCRTVTANNRPDPHNPSYWGAMTSYVFTPLNESAAERLVDAVNSSHIVTTGFSVLMLDAYGGQIRERGCGKHENSSAFPHHDALYHAQILSYFSPVEDDDDGKEAGGDKKEGGSAGAEEWQLAVFDTLDKTQSVHGSYRNYASDLFHKAKQWQYSALARYYGENLVALQNVKRQVDPHGFFSYSQGA